MRKLIWLQSLGKCAIHYLPQRNRCELDQQLQDQKIHMWDLLLLHQLKNRIRIKVRDCRGGKLPATVQQPEMQPAPVHLLFRNESNVSLKLCPQQSTESFASPAFSKLKCKRAAKLLTHFCWMTTATDNSSARRIFITQKYKSYRI